MIMQVPELKSGFVDFAAMSNNMNRDMAMRHITGIQDTPVTDSKFIKVCESTCQRLGLDSVVMLREPLDFIYYPFCNHIIELRKILKCLRRELDVIIQASFNLSFTSWSEMRSLEPRDNSSRVLISSVSSRCWSGSAMMFCNSSCTTFLIRACNSSTVRSAAFIGLPSSII